MPSLRSIRRLWSIFFMALFVTLLIITDYRWLKGYATSLFLELDPLTAIAAFLTSGTLYKGLAIALLVIILTLFCGRFFCSWICPLGILNQWISYFFAHRDVTGRYKINRYQRQYRIKYYILTGLLVFAALGSLQIGLFDPIALITRSFVISVLPATQQIGSNLYFHQPFFHGGILISVVFIVLMLANRFMPRFWCRILCPLGALLGILSARALWRIQRDVTKCIDCEKCLQFCQGGCDPNGLLRVTECHLCMNCIENCPTGALHYGLPRTDSSVQQALDIDRRRLFESAIVAFAALPMLRSSISANAIPTASVIRPPGALPEADFLARCIKCAACMRVCPTNVLQPALLEPGFEGLWTPMLNNRIGYCEHHCVLCGQVCPTGAIRILSIAEKTGEKPFPKPIKIGTAFIDRGRCLPWAMDTPCIVCEEMCPTSPKAIWYNTITITTRNQTKQTLQRPLVEPQLCIGCGICEHKCPVADKAAIRITSVGESRATANRMMLV